MGYGIGLEFREEVINKVNHLSKENHNNNNNIKILKDFPQEPNRIRLRKYVNKPSTVCPPNKSLKDIIEKQYYFSQTNEITIQNLPENQIEEKNSDQDIIIIVRQFFPDKFELSVPVEVKIQKTDKITETKVKISQLVSIPPEQLSVALTSYYELNSILTIPKLKWFPPLPDGDSPNTKYYSHNLDSNQSIHSLHIEDGSILVCRDTSVPLKKLSEADIKKINHDEELKRRDKYKLQSSKEERLSINITDVPIF